MSINTYVPRPTHPYSTEVSYIPCFLYITWYMENILHAIRKRSKNIKAADNK